jgi:hypothetical protein
MFMRKQELAALEDLTWNGISVKKGALVSADHPIVKANPASFGKPGKPGKTYTDAPDGGPGNAERWNRWGIPPR